MKKIFSVLIVLAAILVVLGCGSAAPANPNDGLPDFVRNPGKYKIEGSFVGIGSAKMSTTNMSLTAAETRARAAIARKISSSLKNMIDDYNAEVEGDPATAEAFFQTVTRALSQANLTDTEIEQQEIGPDGTYYVLMSMPKRSALRPANETINREKLQYAKFQNWNAQRDMDAAFAAENSDPEVVSENP
jgi:hypothetical protein